MLSNKALIALLIFALMGPLAHAASPNSLKDGDIIFQTSLSNQSKAIQLATHSKWSHMGLLFQERGTWYVYEAASQVKKTPLTAWIARGQGGHYAVKRLKNQECLTPDGVTKLKTVSLTFAGKPYDALYGWSDDRIYCSELVWKIYKRALDIEIGAVKRLNDFDLTSPTVKAQLKESYGKNIPYNEIIIAPGTMFDSTLLVAVKEK